MKTKTTFIVLAILLLALSARAQLVINGYLSAEYEKGQQQSDFPQGTFGQALAGLMFSGRAGKVFDFNLEVRYKSETRAEIEEAWVGINSSPAFQLKLGLYLVPFGKYNTSNRPYQTPFIQMPLAQARLYPESWRDIGLLAAGKSGSFSYSAYLGNGLREGEDLQAGQQFKDNNKNKGTGGRIGLFLSQSFEVGLSYYRGKYDAANEKNLSLFGTDVSWETETFLVRYEYTRADLDNEVGYSKGKGQGHYVLLSLNFSGISPWASYQKLTYSDPFHGPGFVAGISPGSGISDDQSRWAIGLVYYASANILLKVEYDFNHEGKPELKNNVFYAQVALHF